MAQSHTGLPAPRPLQQAREIASQLSDTLDARSVLVLGRDAKDIETAWSGTGSANVTTVSGDDVDDLFKGQGRADIIHCGGVAGHIPESSACVLVHALAMRTDYVVFSLACLGDADTKASPREVERWRNIFAAHGYDAFDCFRPKLKADLRGDVLLFANLEAQMGMDPDLRGTALNKSRRVPHRGRVGARIRHYFSGFAAPKKWRKRAA
ncbi:MAG: hypothetical protein AAFQ22_08185 [Pseudomonadota bacterium]